MGPQHSSLEVVAHGQVHLLCSGLKVVIPLFLLAFSLATRESWMRMASYGGGSPPDLLSICQGILGAPKHEAYGQSTASMV